MEGKELKEIFEKLKDKIVTFLLCGTLLIIVLSIIALLSGTVMRIFGFEYQSTGSIILFFIIATILSYPLSLLAEALPKALLSLGRLSLQAAKLLYIVLDTFVTFWGLKITDYYMQSVSAKDISILVISLIFALLCMNDVERAEFRR